MTLFTILLIVIVILAIVGLGWNSFAVGLLDGFDRVLDIGIPIIKNLTQEANAIVMDPNPVVQRLGEGGMDAFDQNLKELEEELGVPFTEPLRESLKLETELAVNRTISAGVVP